MKIGFLGPQGSYSFDAAQKYKKIDDELVEYSTIFKVIDAHFFPQKLLCTDYLLKINEIW